MSEIITFIERIPGGTGWVILFLLVFGPPAIFSKTAAEKFGAFGALARWWRNRPLQKIEQDEKQVAAEVAVLERRVKTLEEHIKTIQDEQSRERQEYLATAAEDRKQWRAALEAAEKEIEKVRQGVRVRDQSMFALYDWTIRARVKALDGGVVLPPIPEVTFTAVPDTKLLPHPDTELPKDDTVDP